ncbi:hypothetical protein BDV98DRAFT_557518 [Pterulicium gracile]|uniref:SH3 domain-containing protein n=1 Tax=Pterulicium gracile TaxID=1884261 RepID=A0A5C3QZ83_9AGAR|nr:hypothetical protein BDV98DRAFT_557518 [Pterula gracilis]
MPPLTITSRDASFSRREAQSSPVNLNANVQALTGIIVALAVVVIGLLGWMIYSWRRSKRRSARQTIIRNEMPREKSWNGSVTVTGHGSDLEKAMSTPPSEDGRWRPQIRTQNSDHPLPRKPAALLLATSSRTFSPPPSYRGNTPSSHSHSQPVTPPAPGVSLTRVVVTSEQSEIEVRSPGVAVMHSPPPQTGGFLTVPKSFFDHITPSPRTASFPDYPASPVTPGVGSQKTQRMIVVTTFEPSSEDELTLEVGEELLLLHEFEDTWCLVRRGTGALAMEGMVPRFCLQERSKVVSPN